MPKVNIEAMKQLREMTGAGPLSIRDALIEFNGDIQKAAEKLLEQYRIRDTYPRSRTMSEGRIGFYQHQDNRIGVMVEVNCETDFVAHNDRFRVLVRDIALHISSEKPEFVNRDDIPQARLDEVIANINDDTSENASLEAFYKRVVLLEQPFLKDERQTVQDIINQTIEHLGEEIRVRRFARYEITGASFEDDDE